MDFPIRTVIEEMGAEGSSAVRTRIFVRHLEQLPVIDLVPMSEASFAAYLPAAIERHAEANIKAGRWTVESAPELARRTFDTLLPNGLASPDKHLFDIVAATSASTVGSLFANFVRTPNTCVCGILDLYILAEHRRQGFASEALTRLEAVARAFGAQSIDLHVFAWNAAAEAVYHGLGYATTGHIMVKPLVAFHG